MNCFILDTNPRHSAQYHCNKHLVQMIREGLWMMKAAAFNNCPYQDRLSHMRLHKRTPGWIYYPGTIWAGSTKSNYQWLTRHTSALCAEYTSRYNKVHSLEMRVLATAEEIDCIPHGVLTPFYQGVPEDCKQEDPVQAYRLYYNKYKWPFAVWTNREVPDWFKPERYVGRHE